MLTIEDLHYTYEDGTPALNGIDLEIARGEFVALLGSNGSGKSTLIRHFNGLFKPSLGRVLFQGKEVGAVEDRDVFSKIGIVFQ
ncbi:MAG: ATP-binding cassette domain-containing protein, partial [Desulfuromonadales bacterium]|nr:ATP-binding cassette domain-containing protein [Desulfuromonadales bacterium]NIS43841.1 ATP-binding cassette domain-containing protein [Desulfuromonadales bacterium]